MNSTYSHTIESKIQKTPSGGMWVQHWISSDWFGQQRSKRRRLNTCWWLWKQWKLGGIRGSWKSRIESINAFSPGSLCCLTKNII
jgi:hypothetical protein